MRRSLSDKLLIAAAIAFGVAAVFLPLEVVEVLGAPLVVAGAYFGGRRGGLLVALWAVLCASVAFFVVGNADAEDFVVTVAGYLILGIASGVVVERFRRQQADRGDGLTAARLYKGPRP